MNNFLLATQLYLKAKSNPNENILMPISYFRSKNKFMESVSFVGKLINLYAIKTFKNDFVPMTKENFYYHDREYNELLECLEDLKVKKIIDTVTIDGQLHVKLIDPNCYDINIYKRG